MALFKSQVLTQASGSVGGLTYSHAQGGMYMRARATPVNPNTPLQQQVRNAFGSLAEYWRENLSNSQRSAWENFASNVEMTNRLGDTIFLSGQNHFIRANTARLQVNNTSIAQGAPTTALTVIEDAPTTNELPLLDAGQILDYSASNGLTLAFASPNNWSDSDQNVYLIYQGKPRERTRNYFRGPYRLAGYIQGDGTTPPTPPFDIDFPDLPYPVIAGQRTTWKMVLNKGAGSEPTGQSFARLLEATAIA